MLGKRTKERKEVTTLGRTKSAIGKEKREPDETRRPRRVTQPLESNSFLFLPKRVTPFALFYRSSTQSVRYSKLCCRRRRPSQTSAGAEPQEARKVEQPLILAGEHCSACSPT